MTLKLWPKTLLLALWMLSLTLPVWAAPTEPPANSLGTCYTFYTPDLPPLAHSIGSRWDRFDFRWNTIEDEPGQFTFGPHDAVVDRDRASGLSIVGILGSTAKWAATDCPVVAANFAAIPGHPQAPHSPTDSYWWRHCPPTNLTLAWDDPRNTWGNYVYQTVTHFKGRVDVWEIWNEPDLPTFWSGTPAQYAYLLKTGYQAVKAANPQATVLFAGIAYWTRPTFYTQVFDALRTLDGAAAHDYFFDAFSLHLYSNVANIRTVGGEIQQTMTAKGIGLHPIWLTETGAPLYTDPPYSTGSRYDWAVTPAEAAAYTLQAYAEARSIGIEKFFFFRMHDESMGEKFGLVRNDLSRRPAFYAYQTAARYLQDGNQITGPFDAGAVRRVTFLGTSQGRVDVLWNRTASPVSYTFPALMPTATLIHQTGQTTTLAAVGGQFTVTLAPATAPHPNEPGVYVIGGPTQLLLYPDTTPPTSALRPLPFGAYTRTADLTWDAADTESGYWYAEIALAPTTAGPWETVAGLAQTQSVTQTRLTLPDATPAHPWYFRARARDRAGQWEAWPTAAEISTDFSLTTTVALTAVAYTDYPGSSVGLPLSQVTMIWSDPYGNTISRALTTIWHITQTVHTGWHHLRIEHPDHLSFDIPFEVTTPLTPPQTFDFAPTLHYGRQRLHLPLILRRAI